LDAFELQVFGWLMAEPGITAVEVLKRLEAVAPAGMFATKHLRTVQRALEVWRADVIRQRISECGLDHEARTALEDGGA